MTWTTPPTKPHETLCCSCAAGRVTIGDSTSLLTTYRATLNVVTAKIKPTLFYEDPPSPQWAQIKDQEVLINLIF